MPCKPIQPSWRSAWPRAGRPPAHLPSGCGPYLGWKAASDVENGVALVARYGFTDERWQQLDTSRNKVPSDTAWVLRAAVCTEATCRRTLLTYVTHWYTTGPAQQSTYGTQARQTLDFMQATSEGKPHVLIGDLNVWTAPGAICRQTPNGAEALETLAAAKYIDAWRSVHGDQEGFTGMLNRRGCGDPEGSAWKRIDYAWSPSTYRPLDITRFGLARLQPTLKRLQHLAPTKWPRSGRRWSTTLAACSPPKAVPSASSIRKKSTACSGLVSPSI